MVIQNGDKVKDVVTGFEGIVTGVAEYLTGCRQCCVAPPAKDGDYKQSQWFDDDRLEVVSVRPANFLQTRERDGGPQSNPAPRR